jgi:pimeloyl-ACP methyl ester carboxylesterase
MLYAARQRPDLFRSLALLGTTYHARQERADQALVSGPWDSASPVVQRVFHPQTGILGGWDAPLDPFRVIACPALIIMADRDEFNGPEDGLALYNTLPNAELLVVPHADHIGLVRHPLVMEAVRAFYERVPR